MTEAIQAHNELVVAALRNGIINQPVRQIDGTPFIISPEGDAVSLSKFLEKPVRIKADVKVLRVDSFVDYVIRFCNESSSLYFDRISNKVEAILDHYEQSAPNNGDHTVTLNVKYTPEFNDWIEQNGKLGGQEAFADFIEEHIEDISSPDGATMMDVATEMRATVGTKFSQRVNRSSGAIGFSYQEEVSGTMRDGSTEVPKEFEVTLRPIAGFDYAMTLRALLRYRVSQEGLRIGYKIPDLQRAITRLQDVLSEQLAARTGLRIYT